jgi:hypothetical protein
MAVAVMLLALLVSLLARVQRVGSWRPETEILLSLGASPRVGANGRGRDVVQLVVTADTANQDWALMDGHGSLWRPGDGRRGCSALHGPGCLPLLQKFGALQRRGAPGSYPGTSPDIKRTVEMFDQLSELPTGGGAAVAGRGSTPSTSTTSTRGGGGGGGAADDAAVGGTATRGGVARDLRLVPEVLLHGVRMVSEDFYGASGPESVLVATIGAGGETWGGPSGALRVQQRGGGGGGGGAGGAGVELAQKAKAVVKTVAVKLTGDAHVPEGWVSWVAAGRLEVGGQALHGAVQVRKIPAAQAAAAAAAAGGGGGAEHTADGRDDDGLGDLSAFSWVRCLVQRLATGHVVVTMPEIMHSGHFFIEGGSDDSGGGGGGGGAPAGQGAADDLHPASWPAVGVWRVAVLSTPDDGDGDNEGAPHGPSSTPPPPAQADEVVIVRTSNGWTAIKTSGTALLEPGCANHARVHAPAVISCSCTMGSDGGGWSTQRA